LRLFYAWAGEHFEGGNGRRRRFALSLKALPKKRKLEISRLACPHDKLRSLTAGLLLRRVFGKRRILYTQTGKPYLPDGPFFSLSHSGNLVILAVSRCFRVGVDVEDMKTRDFAGVAKKAFHPEERSFFEKNRQRGPEAEKEAFYAIWTRKESYLKMTGEGLRRPVSDFSVFSLQGVRFWSLRAGTYFVSGSLG